MADTMFLLPSTVGCSALHNFISLQLVKNIIFISYWFSEFWIKMPASCRFESISTEDKKPCGCMPDKALDYDVIDLPFDK